MVGTIWKILEQLEIVGTISNLWEQFENCWNNLKTVGTI